MSPNVRLFLSCSTSLAESRPNGILVKHSLPHGVPNAHILADSLNNLTCQKASFMSTTVNTTLPASRAWACWYSVSLPFDYFIEGSEIQTDPHVLIILFCYDEIVKPVGRTLVVLYNTLLLQFYRRLLQFGSLCIWYNSRMLYRRNSVCLKLDVILFVILSYFLNTSLF